MHRLFWTHMVNTLAQSMKIHGDESLLEKILDPADKNKRLMKRFEIPFVPLLYSRQQNCSYL